VQLRSSFHGSRPRGPCRETDGGGVALNETELEAGTVEGAFEPVGKFHVSCYETMRSKGADDWPQLHA